MNQEEPPCQLPYLTEYKHYSRDNGLHLINLLTARNTQRERRARHSYGASWSCVWHSTLWVLLTYPRDCRLTSSCSPCPVPCRDRIGHTFLSWEQTSGPKSKHGLWMFTISTPCKAEHGKQNSHETRDVSTDTMLWRKNLRVWTTSSRSMKELWVAQALGTPPYSECHSSAHSVGGP